MRAIDVLSLTFLNKSLFLEAPCLALYCSIRIVCHTGDTLATCRAIRCLFYDRCNISRRQRTHINIFILKLDNMFLVGLAAKAYTHIIDCIFRIFHTS